MSETETRGDETERACPRCGWEHHGGADGVCRACVVAIERENLAEQLRDERDEARTEVRQAREREQQHYANALNWRDRAHAAEVELSRLRGVVEAVQALADDMETQAAESTPVMGEVWTVAAREVRRVLAPVSSSGEAESGEVCRCVSAPAQCPVHPAPVPSGGQADGEGEGLVEVVAAKVHEAWMAAKREQGVSSRPSEWGEEQMVPYAALSERAKDLDRATVTAVLDALSAAGFAARPVLSREALRERIDGHWPELSEDRDDFDAAYIVCRCGWRYDYVRDGRSRVASWRDHLADVLTAGGAA